MFYNGQKDRLTDHHDMLGGAEVAGTLERRLGIVSNGIVALTFFSPLSKIEL